MQTPSTVSVLLVIRSQKELVELETSRKESKGCYCWKDGVNFLDCSKT